MRVINLRLLIIVLVSAIILGGGVVGLHAVQIRRHASHFKTIAERAKENGDLKSAVAQMNTYLSLQPRDIEARRTLGFWLVEANNPIAAFRMFEEVLRSPQGETMSDVRRKQVDLAMGLGRNPDAETHLQVLLRETEEKDAEILCKYGVCQIYLGNDNVALTALRKSIDLDPAQVEAYNWQALVLSERLKRPREADACLTQMIRNNPNSDKAYLIHAKAMLRRNDLKTAMRDLKTALAIAPDDVETLVLATHLALVTGSPTEARAYVERGMAKAKGDPRLVIMMSQIELRAGQTERAFAIYWKGIEDTKDQPAPCGQILCHLAMNALEAGRTEDAEKALDLMHKAEFPSYLTQYIEGRMAMAKEDWLKARKIFESIRPTYANRDTMVPLLMERSALLRSMDHWIGLAYGKSGNTERDLVFQRQALAIDPQYAPARRRVAEILGGARQFDPAASELKNLLREGKGDEQTLIDLAQMLVARNMKLPSGQRNWEEVEDVLRRATKAAPNSPRARLLIAQILVFQNRFEEAENDLKALRDAAPKVPEFWIALAGVASRQEKWEQTEKLLADAEKETGDSFKIRLARGNYLLRRFGVNGDEAIRKLLDNVDKFSPAEKIELWRGMIRIALGAKDRSTAKRLCRLIADQRPNDLEIRLLFFELAMRAVDDRDNQKDIAELDAVLKDMERIAGPGPFWLYGRAVRRMLAAGKEDDASLREALDEANKARTMRPSWLPLPLLIASIHARLGNADEALENFVQAIELGETDLDIVRMTLQMLYQRGRFAEANRLLKRMDDRPGGLSPDLNRILIETEARGGNITSALRLATQSTTEDSKNFRDHLWRGQICQFLAARARQEARDDQRRLVAEAEQRAEQAFRRAVELQPKSGDSWLALVQFYASTNQMDKAKETVAEAQEKLPPLEAPLALAYCYMAIGETEQARRKFETALTAAPDSLRVIRQVAEFHLQVGQFDAAKQLLDRVLGDKLKASDTDKAWARRRLARALQAEGGFPNLNKAIALVEQNCASPQATLEDRRLLARFLLSDPRRAKKQEAVQLLADLVRDSEQPSDEDRWLLAQQFLQAHDWPNYRKQIQSILGSGRADPNYIAAHVAAMLHYKHLRDLADAETYLRTLETSGSDNFGLLTLKATLFLCKKDMKAVLDTVKAYIDRPKALPAGRIERTVLAANLLERLAAQLKSESPKADPSPLLKQAEAYYRTVVDQEADKEMVLAVFLARQGRITESLSLVQKCWEKSKPEALALTAIAMFESGEVTPEQAKQIDKILDDAAKKFNRSPSVLVAQGNSYAQQDRIPKAEEVYRELIALDKNNPVAMNNLGVLLALQNKQLDDALEYVEKALTLAGPMASILDSRATVYMARGDTDKALADLEAAVENEGSPVQYFHLARANHMAGKTADAAAALETAHNKGLKRSMLDPPERPIYDKLCKELQQ